MVMQDQLGQAMCKHISPCSAGEYMARLPTFNSDTGCAACDDGMYQDEKIHFATSCLLQPACAPGWYAQKPAKLTSRRVCALCTLGSSFTTTSNAELCTSASNCTAGSREFVQPTRTADRLCASCVLNETYMDDQSHTFRACKAVTPSCLPGACTSDPCRSESPASSL